MSENKNHIEHKSEEVTDFISQVPHWLLLWGNLIILLFIVSLFLFSWFIKYPDVIKCDVVITTFNPPEKVISKTNGRIIKIFVEDNKEVKKNDALAVIESSANYEDVFNLKKIVNSTPILNDEFDFPVDSIYGLVLGDIIEAYSLFQKDYLAYKQNQTYKPLGVQIETYETEKVFLDNQMSLLQDQLNITKQELKLKQSDLLRNEKLFLNKVISPLDWEKVNIEYLQLEKNLKNIQLQIQELNSILNILTNNKKSTTINQNRDKTNLYREMVKSFYGLKKSISEWELNFLLRSSIDGNISFLKVWKENQYVMNSDQIFTIVPADRGSYIGKAIAKAENSGKIQVGQDVNIRLLNFPDKEFGILRGKIISISQGTDNEGKLFIDISLSSKLETSNKIVLPFRGEMVGVADVITEDLRLIHRLFYQFRNVFS